MFLQELPTVHPTHVLMPEVELARAVGGRSGEKCKTGKTVKTQVCYGRTYCFYKVPCSRATNTLVLLGKYNDLLVFMKKNGLEISQAL